MGEGQADLRYGCSILDKLPRNSGDYPRYSGEYRPCGAKIQEIPYVMSWIQPPKPYFSSTILMDLGKPGSDNLRRWMREELAGHPPMSPASEIVW